MRILSVQTVKPSVNATTSTYTQSSTYSQTSSSIMTGIQHQQHRRPSQKSTRLLQEMDNSAKELLAFLGELEDKRSSHTLEFVSRSDDTTRQIKDCLADRAKLYDDNSSTTSSSNSSIGVSKIKQVSNKQVSKKYQSDIKSASNYSSIKSKFENFDSGLSSKHSSVKSLKSVVSQKPVISSSRSSSISSSRNSPANSDSNSISNTNIQNSSQNSSINSSRSSPNNELVSRIKDDSKLFGDSAISIDTDDLPLPPPPPKPEANEFMNSAFLPPPGPVFNKSRPLIAPKPAKLGSLQLINACVELEQLDIIEETETRPFEKSEIEKSVIAEEFEEDLPVLQPADQITKQSVEFESASDIFVSKFEAGKISCSKSKAVFDNIDNLPRRRRAGVKKLTDTLT